MNTLHLSKLDQLPIGPVWVNVSEEWLRIYCARVPLILLRALPEIPDLSTYPRPKGPPTEKDFHQLVDHWKLTAEAESSANNWIGLYHWARNELYPEYHDRRGYPHPCEERVLWIGRNHGKLPPVDWSGLYLDAGFETAA